jgi:hypothetical protein
MGLSDSNEWSVTGWMDGWRVVESGMEEVDEREMQMQDELAESEGRAGYKWMEVAGRREEATAV